MKFALYSIVQGQVKLCSDCGITLEGGFIYDYDGRKRFCLKCGEDRIYKEIEDRKAKVLGLEKFLAKVKTVQEIM